MIVHWAFWLQVHDVGNLRCLKNEHYHVLRIKRNLSKFARARVKYHKWNMIQYYWITVNKQSVCIFRLKCWAYFWLLRSGYSVLMMPPNMRPSSVGLNAPTNTISQLLFCSRSQSLYKRRNYWLETWPTFHNTRDMTAWFGGSQSTRHWGREADRRSS